MATTQELPVFAPECKPPSTLDGLIEAFPFPQMRPQQRQALSVIADSYDQDIQFTILELPTGSGKSGLGIAAGRWTADTGSDGCHYLTSQNILTQQLKADFDSLGLLEVRGKANYDCWKKRDRSGQKGVTVDCETGSLLNDDGKSCPGCTYRIAKQNYMDGQLGCTNYTYYLTERMYSKEIPPREYLVLDEAHNIEREILGLIDIQITQKRCLEVNAGVLPYIGPGDAVKALTWLADIFVPKVKMRLLALKVDLESRRPKVSFAPLSDSGSVSVKKQVVGLNRLLANIDLYLNAPRRSDWCVWTNDDGALQVKPLTAAGFANEYLFNGSRNILMMSGTILNFTTFQRCLGIDPATSRTLALPSDFPKENRRILYWPVGNMSAKTQQDTLPHMADRCAALLTKFKNDKGIIHTHTYRIRDYLAEALEDGPHFSRLLTHTTSPGSRDYAIASHYAASEPTILLSPSMTEGVDLKDALARINIITKIPYPKLDTYNKMRSDRDPDWYALQTAVGLQQATGRPVRNHTDYCLTVILDSQFEQLISRHQDMFAPWWLDSIEMK